ncbi:MAG: hypothetical protein DYG92_02580 [Leptolyngbya sp. PLA1]|nr:hypothetical protein [Leptolyngbya sp. PLA1]
MPLLLGALAGVLAWGAFGPVAATRSIAAAPGETPVEWRRGEGAPINGLWVVDHSALRAPARGIREIRADRPVEVAERVLGVGIRRTALNPRGEWTMIPAGLEVADAMACAVIGALVAWVLSAVASAVRRVSPETAIGLPVATPAGGPWWPGLAAVIVAALVHGDWALTSPLIFCPDSMDYAVRAIELLERGDFQTFDALRTPGFSVVLAALSAGHLPLGPALGVLHALVAGVMAWVVADLAVRWLGPGRLAGGFALVAALAVTLDPVVLLWSRHAMPEMLAMGAATVAAWAACRAGGRWALWALLSGVLAAVAAYMRGNLQMVVVFCPLIVFLSAVRDRGPGRALAAAAICLASAVALLAPWGLRNARTLGVPALAVGTQYARILSASDAGVLDINQSAAFDRTQVARLASGDVRSGFEVIRLVDGSRLAEGPAGPPTHPWIASEDRLRVIADESAHRWPERHWRAAARGTVNLSGLWPLGDPGFREHEWWAGVWRGAARPNFWNRPEDYAHLNPAIARRVYDQNVVQVAYRISDAAWRSLGWWATVRSALAVLSLLSCILFWGAGRRAEAALCLLPWAHAIALAVLTGTGIDRYQAPMLPLGTLAGVLGLWCLLRWVMRLARSRTSTRTA